VKQQTERLNQRSSLVNATFIFNSNPQLGRFYLTLLGYDVTNLLGHHGVSTGRLGASKAIFCKGLVDMDLRWICN
jgi:hypothetical protein